MPEFTPSELRLAWVGFHEEGVPTLQALIDRGESLVGAVTLAPDALARRSGAADIAGVCRGAGVPTFETKNVNDDDCVSFLRALEPDLLIVLGWSQILGAEVLRVPRIGALGAHAALLPHNRGSAPVNWAIIRGETEGGNTLMWLAEGVDSGDIAAQRAFPILNSDTCATVYDKVAVTNCAMVLETLDALARGDLPRRPQQRSQEPPLPRRRPEDGQIEWSSSAKGVYDFIRALTRPYPGAFTDVEGNRIVIWRSALVPCDVSTHEPGKVLGSIVSPDPSFAGVVVACGRGHRGAYRGASRR